MNSRPRSRLKIAVLVVVIVAIIIALIVVLLRLLFPKAVPFLPIEPNAQPADCPDVQVLSIPGTWESSSIDDPYNPVANPNALLLNVSRPLQERFPNTGGDRIRADIYTVPYVAQFSNPVAIPPDGQVSYERSRTEGTNRTIEKMEAVYDHCPLTNYVIFGFSQGAVIAGDLGELIGKGDGPVPAKRLLGIAMIADGRRVANQGIPIGPNPPGAGAEVALGAVGIFTKLAGVSLRGVRDDGFGEVADRVFSICTPGDLICDAPSGANPGAAIQQLMRPNIAHNGYNSFVVDDAGTTATQWTTNWATDLINNAPQPPHE